MKPFFKASLFIVSLLAITISCSQSNQADSGNSTRQILKTVPSLSQTAASNFARIALHCIHREYPNKLSHVMNDSSEVLNPKTLHPCFYGCFDWHSSVHGHWMLVRLLKLFPGLPEGSQIREALSADFTKDNIEIETKYLDEPNRKSFERTYGWSWLLKLATELNSWDDPQGDIWLENLTPLVTAIENRYLDFLPKQEFPIRRGVHPNTAFGLSFALDYARVAHRTKLENLIIRRSTDYFFNDKNIAAKWEPDGDDFLSPSLIEADLMSRVLKPEDFAHWFDQFLPGIKEGKPKNLLNPVPVSDRSDPKIVHLDGLGLSRAWCMIRISKALPVKNPSKEILYQSAIIHANNTLPHIASGNYEGEHWLASFAVYLLSNFGQ